MLYSHAIPSTTIPMVYVFDNASVLQHAAH